MLSDGDRLQQVELLLRMFKLPNDGTYEDMYFQLEGRVGDLIENIKRTIILGEQLSNEEINGG